MVEEIRRGAVSCEPGAMHQETVNFVGEDEFLDFYALLPQPRRQVHRLGEVHVAVVITLDEQNRRAPSFQPCYRRRVVRKLNLTGRKVLWGANVVVRPIVDAVEIHSSRKYVGVS